MLTHTNTNAHTRQKLKWMKTFYGDMDSSITKCRLNVQFILLGIYYNIAFLWGFFISYECKTNLNEKDWYFCTK